MNDPKKPRFKRGDIFEIVGPPQDFRNPERWIGIIGVVVAIELNHDWGKGPRYVFREIVGAKELYAHRGMFTEESLMGMHAVLIGHADET